MATTIKLEPESVIEYSQDSNSPAFIYIKETGAISIKADKSLWLWREKMVKTNCNIYYDTDKYKLLFLSRNLRKFDSIRKVMRYCNYIRLYNTGFFPKFIKKGEILGEAILIPKIDSHVINLDFNMDITEFQ